MTNPAYEATNSDVEKLIADMKEVALRATPGPWRRTSTQFNGITHGPFSFTKEDVLGHFSEKFNAEFVSECDPKNVLALIAALEDANALNKHLDLAIRKAEGCSEALRRRAEVAENRIAELESAPNGMMQLSNELAEMKLPEDFPDDAELLIEIEFLDDVSVDIKTAQWLKELRRRRTAGGAVEGSE